MCAETADLPLGRFLGRGSDKKVYSTKLQGEDVALVRGCAKLEVELMRKVRGCAHVLQLVEELAPHTIATELAEHGSLIDLQDSLEFEGQAVSSDHITVIILQIQKALNAIWDLGFVHADVAERNVLVFHYDANANNTLVKLGDFGEAYASNEVEIDIEQLIEMNLRLRKAWTEYLKDKHGMAAVN